LRTLIVDDNASNRRILEEMLLVRGMTPVLAASAKEAIELLRTEESKGLGFRLVLTDVNMPEIDGFTLAEWIRNDENLKSAVIIVLTSGGRNGDRERCEQLGVAAHLMKPIKQSELFDSIVHVFGVEHIDKQRQPIGPVEVDVQIPPLRILLAEDAIPNQVLAVGLLKKWNHSVEVANNGKEAINRLQSEPFDLVLMDVQMPEMDGLEATKLIRRLERENQLPLQPTSHTPIFAMTAHAMKGDEERCLASGMDGFVSKPIRVQHLVKLMSSLFDNSSRRPLVLNSEDETPAQENRPLPNEFQINKCLESVDWSAALESVQADRELLKIVAEAFLSEYVDRLEELTGHVNNNNAEDVKRILHLLKGVMSTFGAVQTMRIAEQLETMGRTGQLASAEKQLELLRESVLNVVSALNIFVKDPEMDLP